jgi:hypothetical protein
MRKITRQIIKKLINLIQKYKTFKVFKLKVLDLLKWNRFRQKTKKMIIKKVFLLVIYSKNKNIF